MDSDVLNNIPDCKKCSWWYEIRGVCRKPNNIDCPKGVKQPNQTVADMNYSSLS